MSKYKSRNTDRNVKGTLLWQSGYTIILLVISVCSNVSQTWRNVTLMRSSSCAPVSFALIAPRSTVFERSWLLTSAHVHTTIITMQLYNHSPSFQWPFSMWTWVSWFPSILFHQLFQKSISGDKWHGFVSAGRPSHCSTSSAWELKEWLQLEKNHTLASSFLHSRADYTVSQKKTVQIFLLELHQLSTNFGNFWQKEGKEAKIMPDALNFHFT